MVLPCHSLTIGVDNNKTLTSGVDNKTLTNGGKTIKTLTNGIAGVELVGDIAVILPRHSLADGGLHETRQGGQHVDRRIDLEMSSFY